MSLLIICCLLVICIGTLLGYIFQCDCGFPNVYVYWIYLIISSPLWFVSFLVSFIIYPFILIYQYIIVYIRFKNYKIPQIEKCSVHNCKKFSDYYYKPSFKELMDYELTLNCGFPQYCKYHTKKYGIKLEWFNKEQFIKFTKIEEVKDEKQD